MAKKRTASLQLYKTYLFRDKDPVIDRVRTLIKDEGLSHKDVYLLSGVRESTIYNWMQGPTKKPQYATIAAVTSAMGYKQDFVKTKKINFEREIERARAEIAAAAKKNK